MKDIINKIDLITNKYTIHNEILYPKRINEYNENIYLIDELKEFFEYEKIFFKTNIIKKDIYSEINFDFLEEKLIFNIYNN